MSKDFIVDAEHPIKIEINGKCMLFVDMKKACAEVSWYLGREVFPFEIEQMIEDTALAEIANKIDVPNAGRVSHDEAWSLHDEELAKDEQREFEEDLRHGIAEEDILDYD